MSCIASAVSLRSASGSIFRKVPSGVSTTLLKSLGIDWFENTAWGGADLRPSRETGMPVADLTPDGTYYFDYHHTEDDTFDKIVPEDLSQSVAAMVSLAYFAAETPATFRRVPAEKAE